MKTTIYLVRHGQSEGNLHDQFIGHTDIALTDLGRQQAMLTAQYLKDIPVDKIYSSDLVRAYETACITAKLKNLTVTKVEGMRELYAGEWETKNFPTLGELYKEDFHDWCHNFGHARCTGGESVLELQERIVNQVRAIAEENPGKAVAIFCHATPIRVFRAYCDGATADTMGSVPWASNASVTHAEYEDGKFRLVEYSIDHFMGKLITAFPDGV